jgi:predicted ATPase
LQVRVGIATGLVVVGDLIGAGAAQEQAVVGETPNLAARLQALAEPGAVVIAAATRRLTGGLFDYRDLGATTLKGFAGNVPAWQVLGASAIESRFEAMRTATTPLVGRDEETDLLGRRWEQAKQGEGRVVLISGEPGIGKSRIAETILERLSNEPHIRLRYFCSPHHQDSPLYPSIAQLERAAGFRRDDADEQRLNKLEAVLARGTNDLSEAVPLLAALLSIPTGDRYPPLNLTPQKRKEKTLHAQLTQVEGLAAQQPVLMVWEDVHWSDPTTRESLDLLIDRVSTLRVLVILTFRPEFAPPWIGRPHVTMLNLNRLPPRQRAQMIVHVTGGRALPKEIAEQIVNRTDGVPLFIEELTKSVIESGIVTETGDHYAAIDPVAPVAIPASLHASLLARLDRLAPTREVAQIAAALGRQFSHELISAIAMMPQQQLDDALGQLVRAELIFRRGTPPDAEYTFKHALVQDAAYSTLLRSRRQQLHGRIATTLETRFPEVVTDHPELMAHHCAEAGMTDRAVGYRLKAGQQSVARGAMTEAVTQLKKGLDLLTGLPNGIERQQHELDLQMALSLAIHATEGYGSPAMEEIILRASTLAEKLDKPECLVPLLYGKHWLHVGRAQFNLAQSIAEQIETIGAAKNDKSALLLGHFLHASDKFMMGYFESAMELFNQSRGIIDPPHYDVCAAMMVDDPHVALLACEALTLTYMGHIERGRTQMAQAVGVARELGRAYPLIYALIWAAWSEWVSSSAGEARLHAEEAVTLSNEHGFPAWLAWGLIHKGWSLAALGEVQEGVRNLTEGISIYRSFGAVSSVTWALILLAEVYARVDRVSEGLGCLVESEQIIERTEERYSEAELYRLRGDLLIASGDRTGAEQNYQQALALATRQSTKVFELRAATSLARLWRDQGKPAEARDLLAPIYGWFTEGFDTRVLQDAKALLDELT